MPRNEKKKKLIELKGTTMPVVAVTLRSLQAEVLEEAAGALFGDEAFFDGDAALLELSQLDASPAGDWTRASALLKKHGLTVIGVCGGSEELRASAAEAGLPAFAAVDRKPRPEAVRAAPAEAPPPPDPLPVVAPVPVRVPTMVVDRPLRSGQQVYARGGDLVVLAAVNAGAEVIADGSIHIYAPLRGRALAGASGAADARIFTTRFEAELVSIAGVYRTFETAVPGGLAGKPAQVRLIETTGAAAATGAVSTLAIEALKTD